MIVTENSVWLALEYCDGDELYNYLLSHGKLETSKVQKIFTQLVGAVSYVHGKKCVHRDLKLENILLDKNENVKLVDFGFTREYNGTTSYLQTWCGTVCYSAPEMLKGEKYAGEKVDVWSLGIILFALLCGELPFDEDDETATKNRILKEDPIYPEYVPQQAKELIQKLLSKRPLLRPSLADILRDPYLAEHAPQQQEILKLQQPPPFSTELEKDTLQRMKSAGVNIDMVIEHVLAQRCDSLAGWWALLIEKEERKQRRRERKRREREETKSIRRLSAASSRLLATPSLMEINEEMLLIGDAPRTRGRGLSRSNGNTSIGLDLPIVKEGKTPTPETSRPPPIEKDLTVAQSSRSHSRPPLPPKEYSRRPRNNSRRSSSMLRMVTNNPDLLSPDYVPQLQRKKKIYQQPIREQLASLRNWFKDSAKRAKSPSNGANGKANDSESSRPAPHQMKSMAELKRTSTTGVLQQHRKTSFGARPDLQTRQTFPARPRISTVSSTGSAGSGRIARSPNALTPRSSYRRSSAGLRGRKSTSSSVSSIRSMTRNASHRHSHSKASSTSSTSLASPSGMSTASGRLAGRSPHASVKVLPGTPVALTFPSGIRVARKSTPSSLGSLPGFAEARGAFGGFGTPSSPGVPVFAKRKRTVFKGPAAGIAAGGSGGHAASNNSNGSRGNSVQGRRSGEQQIIEEEDEEEEVEEFSPIDGPSGGFESLMYEHERNPMEHALDAISPGQADPFGPTTAAGEELPNTEETHGAASTVQE